MKTTIITQEKNPLLEREEFTIKIESETPPTKEAIIKDLGKNAEATLVRSIKTHFGKHLFVADVVVYTSPEAKHKHTVIPKKIRAKMEKERKDAIEKARKEKEAAAKAAAEAQKKAEEEAAAQQEAARPQADTKPAEDAV